ncbi:hypothetical protein [Streptomyces sp. NPDC057702]|uniref:hypothetical protein n=1 Tax=unclassified Streptomyces TaxID=2593676 RepID=UPI0036862B95
METARISLPRDQRRSLLLGLAVTTLLLGLFAWYVLPRAYATGPDSGLVATVVLAGIWLPTAFYTLNRAYGATVLTAGGVRFRTAVSRRTIPWHQVTRFEARERSGRGAVRWWVIRAHRSTGRPLVLPGSLAQHGADEAFQATLDTLDRHLLAATSAAPPRPPEHR